MYKPGTKVRIVGNHNESMGPLGHIDHWLGQLMTIKETLGPTGYLMEEDNGEWLWDHTAIDRAETTDAIDAMYQQKIGVNMTLEERVSRIEQHIGLEEEQAVQYYRNQKTHKVARVDQTQSHAMLVCGDHLVSYYEIARHWEPIPHVIHDGQELYDGCLVECTDKPHYTSRELRFFDAENNMCFGAVNGQRKGCSWNYYRLIQQEQWPDWAHETYERLELT